MDLSRMPEDGGLQVTRLEALADAAFAFAATMLVVSCGAIPVACAPLHDAWRGWI